MNKLYVLLAVTVTVIFGWFKLGVPQWIQNKTLKIEINTKGNNQ